MKTLQVSARALMKELNDSRDEAVIKVVEYLGWAARRNNTPAARVDIKAAHKYLQPPTNHEQARVLERVDALLHPAPKQTSKNRGSPRETDAKDGDWDWCDICGATAVRYFKPHHSQYLVAVCDRHTQPHLRGQDLAMIQCAMAAPERIQGLLDMLGLESAVNLEIEDGRGLLGANESETAVNMALAREKWVKDLLKWWKSEVAKSVIEAWRGLTSRYPDYTVSPYYEMVWASELCRDAFKTIKSHFAEIDAEASQQNGRGGGRPPIATEAQIHHIRQLAAKGVRQVDIAAQVGLSQAHVSRLLKP
ncbi:hypothetical protein [Acidiferrobacter sp. SPIII_3]|jgi:hypothetical protein|uniref:hypothetical protein n=1 Tax=Acidiferrobacter sp. SPIII_3 TaxID=1281578 RepID=UPI0011AB646B|nr:hypothetical protein [Acidiferrobacter sp. SPIII_3]